MTGMKVVRVKRDGDDRLYITFDTDLPVGWLDVASGELHPAEPDLEGALRDALNEFLRAGGFPPLPAPPHAEAAAASALSPTVAHLRDRGRDLSLNRPGEGVRAKATEEWDAAKDRSKFWAYTNRVLDTKTDERAWRVGAAGEEMVGPKLEKLIPRGWRVLHSVPVGTGDSDIDHVLIGPGGVFTINTKYHPGARVWVAQHQIRVNNQPTHYLTNSRHEGERATRLLSRAAGFEIDVTPCLVILTGGLQPNVTYKQLPDDVLVLDTRDVPRVFKRWGRELDDDVVEAVFEVARWESTWR